MKRRKAKQVEADSDEKIELSAADKIAGLLALLVTRDMETDDAAMRLLGVGFTAREISTLLGVGDNYVHVVKNRRKRSAKKKSTKR